MRCVRGFTNRGASGRGAKHHLIGLLKAILAAVIGACLGLAATWLALERNVTFGETRLGPWIHNPRAAYADADPYTRAHRARMGDVPLSQGEGLLFFATASADGSPLDPRCDYVISGPMPPARLWTLSAMTPDGQPTQATATRTSISSAEIVRDHAGGFDIIASARARPGNWLPLPPTGAFVFMLRLYDTSGSAAAGVMTGDQMPGLRRGRCA